MGVTLVGWESGSSGCDLGRVGEVAVGVTLVGWESGSSGCDLCGVGEW